MGRTRAELRRSPGAEPLLPALEVDRRSSASLPAQLYLGLRRAVLEGRIPAGARLPPTRTLAASLRISRQCVVAAYEQLVAEGFFESRVGSGTRVASRSVVPAERPSRVRPHLTAAAQRVGRLPASSSPWSGPLRPFKLGTPALDLAPLAEWGRLLRAASLAAHRDELDYGDELGLLELRSALAERLYRTRAIACSPDQILITSGSQQALDLVVRLLVDEGDAVWCEDPLYPGARGAFTAAGAEIVPVPVDEQGIAIGPRAAAGARGRRGKSPRLLYVTPSHQFPTGVTMTLERRLCVLDWARRHGAFVVEDDYDSEFRFEGPPLAALYGLAEDSRVIYVGTFSKLLFPSIRFGYLVLPAALVEPARALRRFVDGFPPTLPQRAAARLLAEGHVDRHLKRAIVRCRERRDALVAAAQRELAPFGTLATPAAGLHTVLWLREGTDDRRVAIAAARAELDVIPVSAFSRRRDTRQGLVLGFAAFAPREIDAAARRLAEVLENEGGRPPRDGRR
jgi:GntR family transcriptional regulator/MocR family aminotransferase